jgi:hypothetical protein
MEVVYSSEILGLSRTTGRYNPGERTIGDIVRCIML